MNKDHLRRPAYTSGMGLAPSAGSGRCSCSDAKLTEKTKPTAQSGKKMNLTKGDSAGGRKS